MKRALIFDLDNTLYPVSSISDDLFAKLFKLLNDDAAGVDHHDLIKAQDEMTRKPFHVVADKYGFSRELKNKGIDLLRKITYDKPMHPFAGYSDIRGIEADKFLVTTGFTNLQRSKIDMLGIANDFKEIHIVDPELSALTKKDVFEAIIERHNYMKSDFLVIGDDPDAEIKAAAELGIDTFLFDPNNNYSQALATYRSNDLRDVIIVQSNP